MAIIFRGAKEVQSSLPLNIMHATQNWSHDHCYHACYPGLVTRPLLSCMLPRTGHTTIVIMHASRSGHTTIVIMHAIQDWSHDHCNHACYPGPLFSCMLYTAIVIMHATQDWSHDHCYHACYPGLVTRPLLSCMLPRTGHTTIVIMHAIQDWSQDHCYHACYPGLATRPLLSCMLSRTGHTTIVIMHAIQDWSHDHCYHACYPGLVTRPLSTGTDVLVVQCSRVHRVCSAVLMQCCRVKPV